MGCSVAQGGGSDSCASRGPLSLVGVVLLLVVHAHILFQPALFACLPARPPWCAVCVLGSRLAREQAAGQCSCRIQPRPLKGVWQPSSLHKASRQACRSVTGVEARGSCMRPAHFTARTSVALNTNLVAVQSGSQGGALSCHTPPKLPAAHPPHPHLIPPHPTPPVSCRSSPHPGCAFSPLERSTSCWVGGRRLRWMWMTWRRTRSTGEEGGRSRRRGVRQDRCRVHAVPVCNYG